MARFYSDHMNSNATPGVSALAGTAAFDAQRRSPPGLGHSRVYSQIARMTVGTAAIGDELRFLTMRSGDRLGHLYVSSAGGSTALLVDIGLYKHGKGIDAGVGAVIDADLFGSAVDVNAGLARTDEYTEAGTLDDENRWTTLWEVANVGDGSYTEDPFEDWDIVLTPTAALTTAVEEIVVEAVYKSSGS
jgi:hypothetical protein